MTLDAWSREEGAPAPLGVTWIEELQAYNFALYSKGATAVSVLLYEPTDLVRPSRILPFHFPRNRTNRVWHRLVQASEAGGARCYAYKVDGPRDPEHGMRFDPDTVLLDPYAREVIFPPGASRAAAAAPGADDGKAPLGVLPPQAAPAGPGRRATRHTHDLIIYELHVRNFTADVSSGLRDELRGTFAGLKERIPYLRELGVTAVELMPVHQYDPQERSRWGYMTLAFFAPHHAYSSNERLGGCVREFRELVEALHEADLEVLLDVAFNHTTEQDETGPTYSLRGIDNDTYYLLQPGNLARYTNNSACGNDLRTAHPATRRLVIDSLRYWASEIGVDGFRFDLASIFMRDDDGNLNFRDPAILSDISSDPALAGLRLIAEPWQGAPGGYAFGRRFPGMDWWQWNDHFRDDVRRFVKGDEGVVGDLKQRLMGSPDVFSPSIADAYRPRQSVNYVTSHDGFCLYDLVAYTDDAQNSWNCRPAGTSGDTPEVLALRKQQIKNFCCLLMLANGTPMFVAGDEILRTQRGQPNPYDRDDETVWMDWSQLNRTRGDVFRFFREMIAFRKRHPSLGRSTFWGGDVRWYDVGPQSVAFFLDGRAAGDDDVYAMINCHGHDQAFPVPEGTASEWVRSIDTSRGSPGDITEPGDEAPLKTLKCLVQARSIVVLLRRRTR